MKEDLALRRSSSRARKVAPKVTEALLDSHTRAHIAQARLDALESDNLAADVVLVEEEEEASADEEEEHSFKHKGQRSGPAKRKTRQSKAAAAAAAGFSARKAPPRSFLELLQEAGLEMLPPYVPSYITAAVGPPSSGARRHFCSVCGYLAPYTCVRCGFRFCCVKCHLVHNDTRCQKHVA